MAREKLLAFLAEEAAAGALIDLWIERPTGSEWKRLVQLLPGLVDRLELRIDGRRTEIPDDLHALFARARETDCLFDMRLRDASLQLHPISPEILEFVVGPRDWNGSNVDRLLKIMEELGLRLGKGVLLGHRLLEIEVLRYDPIERTFRSRDV